MSNQLGVKGTGSQFATDDNTPPTGSVGTAQIAADAVNNAKLADMAAYTTKANPTSGAANPVDATRDQMSIMLDRYMRQELRRSAEGLIAESQPRHSLGTFTSMSPGFLYLMGVPLLAGDVLTRGHFMIANTPTAPTGTYIGLYGPTGTKLAETVDLSALMTAPTTVTGAFVSPYTVLTSGLYYAALLVVGAAVAPTAYRGNNVLAALAAINGGQIPNGGLSGQTGLPASVALSAVPALSIWIGFS